MMEDRLEFLAPRPGGGCALGSSGMTARQWCGGVWLYTDPLTAPEMATAEASFQMQAGVPCGVWVTKDILTVAEDGGSLQWLSAEKPGKFTSVKTSSDNTNTVNSMAINGSKLITASADNSVRVYDISLQQCETTYKPAHAEACLSVAAHPSHHDIFVTTSRDGNVLLWDTRQEKPASGIYRDPSCPATCVVWQESSDSSSEDSGDEKSSTCANVTGKLLLGTIDGQLLLQDITARDTITSAKVLKRQVTTLKHRPENKSHVAVCGNEETVKMVNVADDIRVKYTSVQHSDLVSDMLWLSNTTLLSCGWDSKVNSHSPPT